jgi:hypothetical protein
MGSQFNPNSELETTDLKCLETSQGLQLCGANIGGLAQNSSSKIGCFPSAEAQYIEEEDENDFKFRVLGLSTDSLLEKTPDSLQNTLVNFFLSLARRLKPSLSDQE